MNSIIEKLVEKNDPNYKVIYLNELNDCEDTFLSNLLDKLKKNSYVGNIIWPSNFSNQNSQFVTQIENKIKENNWRFERFPNYFVHLLLSNHVYDVSEKNKNQKITFNDKEFSIYNEGLADWIVKEVLKSNTNGYLGAIYINKKTKQMIVAHKGTYNLEDVKTDIDGVFRGLKVDQQIECLKLTKTAKKISKNGKLYNVSTTGHSLGVFYIIFFKKFYFKNLKMFLKGWLAEQCLYFFHTKFGLKNCRAITFDSPGSFRTIDSLKPNIDNSNNSFQNSELDIITYLSEPNLVNTADKHIGKVFSCLNNKINSWKSWTLDKILSSLKLSSNLNHSLYIILDTMKSDFDSKSLNPINEEINYKPTKYNLMDDWPLIEQNSGLKTKNSYLTFSVLKVLGNFLIKNIKPDQLENYYNEDLDKLKKEFYSNYKINVSSIKNTFQLNLNGTINVDILLYKLLDANIDIYPNQLTRSQLNDLRNVYKKEVTIFKKTKLISKDVNIEKIKEIMIRLINVDKYLGSYLESNKNIQVENNNKDINPANFLIAPNPYFCGRDEILKEIKTQFQNEKQIVILSSIPGMGKTEIANQYAQNLKNERSDIIINWFKSDSSDNLLSELIEFSERLGNQKLTDKEKLIKRVNDKINNLKKEFLFIFDNCEAEDIKDYLINIPNNIKILITTKIKQENLESLKDRIYTIELESFKLEESKIFAKSVLKLSDEDIGEIFKLLSDHISKLLKPISLNKIVAKIKNEKDNSISRSFRVKTLINKLENINELVKEDTRRIRFILFINNGSRFYPGQYICKCI